MEHEKPIATYVDMSCRTPGKDSSFTTFSDSKRTNCGAMSRGTTSSNDNHGEE